MTQQYCKWYKHEGEWLVAVPFAFQIDPLTRKVPIRKFGNTKVSFITIEPEPIVVRNLPSGTYSLFRAKIKPVKLDESNLTG